MNRKIDFNKFLIFDGAMGTMIQKYGLKQGELPECYNILYPDLIGKIHSEYINAGCNVITTNTFGANRYKLKNTGYSVEQVIKAAVKIAKKVSKDNYVALDISSIGQLMEPCGTLSFEEAYDAFAEQVKVGRDAGVDLILIETMSDIYEAKAAILAAKENSNLPIICTMTFQEDGRTLTGTDPLTMVNVLQGLGVSALGINCSLGPKEIIPIVKEIVKYSKVPIIVQPNAGLPKFVKGETVFDVEAEEFTSYLKIIAQLGVTILGGCCGTTPIHIKALKELLDTLQPVARNIKSITAVSSDCQTVILGNGVKIIGERINPTGKKKLKEALKTNNMDYILNEAIDQRDAGAHILDVNVGLPEIDEKTIMVKAIKEIQSVVNLPLQIDSVRADVIEAAARSYNGKPLINSVNGKEKVMQEIFPIVKKYGGCVIGLTLDDSGIPSKAEDRFKIAQKIVRTAKEYGICKEDIIIDCLVLTASAQQSDVQETIKAVKLVKEKLDVKTILGISNVSFGLPNRALLNRTFLTVALGVGLDASILNPLDKEMVDTISAFNVLWNHDKQSKHYIGRYLGTSSHASVIEKIENKDLKKAIIDGLKDEAKGITKELLKEFNGMYIVDNYLIPSLDVVGKKFETGEMFLPQLIQSAETVKKIFEIIKDSITLGETEEANISKGKIILATVKGDVHDIGKNIVKILLQNYGFDVIDLGKDVPIEIVVAAVKEHKVKLVGLSALMTTTVRSMEETITALRENELHCKVFVGGAVLNEEYAGMIKADWYAKDVREAVKIAQEFFS
ncbi:homocysteine S-methyltransferase family protein [Clostridium sp.]|uniref:homocysteine S-methyltransferase family protein n=1 Tax=Clostridium sp. TaxID=1506 RepID=UPI001A3EBD7F|nr:homocysteine S-methyltransferase family protein [Clostridium sp.]MBK5243299.1 homocysteine S-methyltransferase family protein [Clostridium sp.]